jgi:hypothetical protein
VAGFVYIMSNPSFADGRIKIGKSDRDPEEFRKSELNTTGVPEPFKVEYSVYVKNHHELEKEIHQHFDTQRPNKNREFFTCSISEAIEGIRKIAGTGIKYEEVNFSSSDVLPNQKPDLQNKSLHNELEELAVKFLGDCNGITNSALQNLKGHENSSNEHSHSISTLTNEAAELYFSDIKVAASERAQLLEKTLRKIVGYNSTDVSFITRQIRLIEEKKNQLATILKYLISEETFPSAITLKEYFLKNWEDF